ncbi:hypothetical protein J1N35_026472 [Gossypium stocksii]|uniref:Uncharacterized protein n=1 Tax=Gossypium stocksii TaxID=47602 RepID=A0A9D3V7Z3_9ROSI|nr:hypothetical protein J1N35_026472 [Gossypium stocksii]
MKKMRRSKRMQWLWIGAINYVWWDDVSQTVLSTFPRYANLWLICGTQLEFLEYDSSILTLGLMKFMRICIRLDISLPLKRKKKIQIEPAKIVFYWDISLRAVVRRRIGGSVRLMGLSGAMRVWKITFKEPDKWRNVGSRVLINDDSGNGPTYLLMEEENDPLVNLEGKKWQRIMNELSTIEGNMEGEGLAELMVSYGE